MKGAASNPSSLISTNNLSDVASPSTALSNLGGAKGGVLQALAQAAAFQLTLPAKGVIESIIIKNNTANAVTGGLKFGTTEGGVDIVAALAVGANFLGFVLDSALLKRIFSTSASQILYIDAVAAWNSATVDASVLYRIIP